MQQRKIRVICDGEVLFISHFSGIGHYTLELLRAIDRQLDNDTSIRFYLTVNFRLKKDMQKLSFRNIRPLYSPLSQRISNGLKRRNLTPPLDLLFGQAVYIFPNYSSWPLLYSKNISFIYDLSFEKFPEFAEPRNQVFLVDEVRKTARRANMIATISENSKREICEFYDISPKGVKIFYPAVDTSIFHARDKNEVATVMQKYGIKGEYILFVGNIEPRKNLINLLLAYEKLPQPLQERYSLLLVGAKGWEDGEIFETISRLRKQGNNIQLPTDYVVDDDLPALYSGAKAFVYPSIYEGFGIPPIEAMACDTPVVTSNNSSLPEVVGEAALLADAMSSDNIAYTLSELLTNEATANTLIEKGKRQLRKFSWDKTAIEFIGSIKDIVS